MSTGRALVGACYSALTLLAIGDVGGPTGWASLVPLLFILAVTDAAILLTVWLVETSQGASGGRGHGRGTIP
jgi:hypothetical protein